VDDSDLRARYLDLVKSAVTFSLWPEPGLPLGALRYRFGWLRRVAADMFTAAARPLGWTIMVPSDSTEEERRVGAVWPGLGTTMVGRVRLDALQRAMETVIAEGIPGDVIETGVWRGGATILMRAVLLAHGVRDRRVFVADSFEGLPAPDPAHAADAGDQHDRVGFLAVSKEEVEQNFERFGLLDDQVVFLKGWFKDTLPAAPISRLAVLRIDGDMWGSTMDALSALYPRLSAGGYCIVDDYALPGCRAAVDEYRRQAGIATPIESIDWTGIMWRRP